MSNSDGEDCINYYQNRNARGNKRKHWIHPYIRNYANFRLFVTTKELSESDRKLMTFYRMSKESYIELAKLVSPSIEKMDTHLR